MFHVRPITTDELVRFSRFAACQDRGFAPATSDEFEQWLRGLWATGQSCAERCWVAERGDKLTAAVVYWRRDNRYHIEHFHPSEDGSDDGWELLVRSIRDIQATGGRGVWAEVVSPPMADLKAAAFVTRLNELGFNRVRHRLRFRRSARVEDIRESRLVFRSCTDVGETAFVQAWAAVSALSQNHEIAKAQDEEAARADAAKAFAEAKGDQNDLRHFELAYLPDGTLAGLVAPGAIHEEPVIHFYGVAPGLRCNGFGRDLLMRGVHSLALAGAESVRLDAVAANVPSVRAILACGFKEVRSYSWCEIVFS